MRVYLDTCCLNRLFDPSREERVQREAEAVSSVMGHIYWGEWIWIGSDVLDAELNANPNRQVRTAETLQLSVLNPREWMEGSTGPWTRT